MKKYGWKFLVLLALAALIFIWLIRAPILSSYLSNKMGIQVSILWIGLWPSHTNIHDFAVKNPPGFKGRAFTAKEITCDYGFRQLFGEPKVIDQIEIENSLLTIDFINPLSTSNNWTALGKMMPKRKRKSHVIIRKLILTDFNVAIHGANALAKAKQTHFDRLEFDNIDSQEGFPTRRLVKMIFQGGGIDQYIEDVFNPEKDVEEILSPLKIFGS